MGPLCSIVFTVRLVNCSLGQGSITLFDIGLCHFYTTEHITVLHRVIEVQSLGKIGKLVEIQRSRATVIGYV